jgi:hypothetical protein
MEKTYTIAGRQVSVTLTLEDLRSDKLDTCRIFVTAACRIVDPIYTRGFHVYKLRFQAGRTAPDGQPSDVLHAMYHSDDFCDPTDMARTLGAIDIPDQDCGDSPLGDAEYTAADRMLAEVRGDAQAMFNEYIAVINQKWVSGEPVTGVEIDFGTEAIDGGAIACGGDGYITLSWIANEQGPAFSRRFAIDKKIAAGLRLIEARTHGDMRERMVQAGDFLAVDLL